MWYNFGVESVMKNLVKAVPEKQRRSVELACAYALENLQTIKRRSGEDYAVHGYEVAQVLSEATSDSGMIAIALLHDILVHPDGKELLAASPLKLEQREIVEKAHTLRRLHIASNTEDLDTVIDAFLEDERLLPLRMAHRLNDVRHLKRFSPALQKQIARETLYMYTAIAGRMGMNAWRHEMEDVCFCILNPKISSQLRANFQRNKKINDESITQTTAYLKKALKKEKIRCDTGFRIKGLYSTYRKMVLKKRKYEELTDRLAIRILVDEPMDCYRALAVVHQHMHPIPGKLKDYIGSPKENGYQSIHTVVYPLPGVTQQPIEVQIRTHKMHEECEFGALAHGQYKNYIYALHTRPARVNLFRNFQSLREEADTSQQFADALRQYFREDHLAIFDTENNLYHLKKPVTALDFVCHAWPNRVSKLKSVFINGRRRAIDTPLNDGDIVDAQFGRKKTLQKHWANACKHRKSRKLLRELSS